MHNTFKKEKVKTAILVVLFFSTVLLSYFYLQNMTFYNIKENVNEHLFSSGFYGNNAPDISKMIYPDSIKINYGDGTYSVFQDNYNDIWNALIAYCTEVSKSEDVTIDEITSELWNDTMDMKSVQYLFNYNLPVSYFEIIGSVDFAASNYFNYISAIAYSEASKSSIFILDSTENKYYRIAFNSENESIIEIINQLKHNKKNQYYPIYMLLGTDNTTMIPFSTDITIPKITISSNNKDIISSYEKKIAETFFGQSLDFIRKITDDSGTITYMYGMGQKILTIYNNGRFEYREEPSNQSNNINLKKAFTIAQSFIANHGSWSSYDGKELNLKLTNIKTDYDKTSKNSSYKLCFNEIYNNYPIFNSETSAIEIEIKGSTVTYYCRNIHTHAPNEIPLAENENIKNESLINILSNNYILIDKLLQKYGMSEENSSETQILDNVIDNISNIETGYFACSSDQSNNYFKPTWVISFSNLKIFFDLYSGEYLGYKN